MAYQAILRKLPSAAIMENLEDVLTASVFGAVSYAPPAVVRAFLDEIAHAPGDPGGVVFEFWPQHHLSAGNSVEPDVLVGLGGTDRAALIIEAKQNDDPGADQLLREARAARATIPGLGPLHLLTVSDKSVPPVAHSQVKAPAGPYRSVAHVSWSDLYLFLERQANDRGLDLGDRRLFADALEVLAKHGRQPFRGMSTMEVRRMETELRGLYALPTEISRLNQRLERAVGGLEPPLHYNFPVRSVMIDSGGRRLDNPDSWLTRAITLLYGPTPKVERGRHYFVRFLVRDQSIWIGYSMDGKHLRAIAEEPDLLARLVDTLGAGPLRRVALRRAHRPARGHHRPGWPGTSYEPSCRSASRSWSLSTRSRFPLSRLSILRPEPPSPPGMASFGVSGPLQATRLRSP